MLRTLGACQRVASGTELLVARSASLNLSLFDPVPQLLIDNPQIWLIADDPFAFGVETRDPRNPWFSLGISTHLRRLKIRRPI